MNNIVIGLIFAAGGVNSLLAALLLRAQGRNLVVLLVGGIIALLMACRWFFENPFHSARPLTTLVDVVTVAVVLLLLNAMLVWHCWPLAFVMLLEILLIVRFWRSNRPKRR